MIIDEANLRIEEDHILLISPKRLKTLSSAVLGAGFGLYANFVNRHVCKNYQIEDYRADLGSFINAHHLKVGDTVAMMTAVHMKHASFRLYEAEGFSIFVVVTAGVGNAIDSSIGYIPTSPSTVGTINTWIFINGTVSDEAFVQSIMTATEAKTKALHDLQIYDSYSKTLATGTSTDSILIAATQKGVDLPYAGTATPLGRLIGKAIYKETKQAIINSEKGN